MPIFMETHSPMVAFAFLLCVPTDSEAYMQGKRNTFLPVKNYFDNRFQTGMIMAVIQANGALSSLLQSRLTSTAACI